MSDNTYNGWTNWETWLTALHINETPSILETFQLTWDYEKPHDNPLTIKDSTDILKEYIMDFFHEFSGGYVEETLHIESHHIDWNEICDSLYEEESWDYEDSR